jgi:hypothetical protein
MNLRSTDLRIVTAGRSDCCEIHAQLAVIAEIPEDQRHLRRVRIVREIPTISGEWNYMDNPPDTGDVYLAADAGALVYCTSAPDFTTSVDGKHVGTSTFAIWPSLGGAILSAFQQAYGNPNIRGVELANIPSINDRTAGQRARWQ